MEAEEESGTNRIREEDGLRDLHNREGLHANEARPGPGPRVAEHHEEMSSIKPKVSLSCKECTYKTNYLPRRMARRRLRMLDGVARLPIDMIRIVLSQIFAKPPSNISFNP